MQTDNNTTRRKGERVRRKDRDQFEKKKRKNKIFEFQVQDVIQGV